MMHLLKRTSSKPHCPCSLPCIAIPKYTVTWKLCIQIALLIGWESDLVCTHENEAIYITGPFSPQNQEWQWTVGVCFTPGLILPSRGLRALGKSLLWGWVGVSVWGPLTEGERWSKHHISIDVKKPPALAGERGLSLHLGQQLPWGWILLFPICTRAQYRGDFLLAQWERVRLQCRRCGFAPWVGKIPWRRAWQPTAVFLPGESHRQRSLAGYSPSGHRVRHDWAANDRATQCTWTHLDQLWLRVPLTLGRRGPASVSSDTSAPGM